MMFGNISLSRYAKSHYSHFYNTKRTYYETFYKVVDVGQLLSKSISDIQHFRKTVAPIQILNIPFDTSPGPFFGGKAILQFIDTQGNVILYEENVYSSLVYVNAAMAHKSIEAEVDEKLKLADLLHWKKHYQNWSDNQ